MEKQLEFFKEKIIQTLSEVRNDIGETRYSLYVQMVLQCNNYDELKEMAELEMQLDSIAYTKQSIKDKLTEQSVDIKDLRKVCYPPYDTSDEQVLETGELDNMLDDPNTLSLMALQLQKRLEETPPEELQRPQEFDADDFLTEDERLNNLAIQFERESIEEALEAGIPIEEESEDEDEEEQDNDTFDTSDLGEEFGDDEQGDEQDDEQGDEQDDEQDNERDNEQGDTFDTSDFGDVFEDDEDSDSEDESSNNIDTFDTDGLFEDEESEDEEESNNNSEDESSDNIDTFDTDGLFEDEEETDNGSEDNDDDSGQNGVDTFDTDGLFEDEEEPEDEEESEDEEEGDTFNTDGLSDDLFEDEEEPEEEGDTFSTDGLGDIFGGDDEDDTQSTQNTQTQESTTSQYDENGRKLTFIKGPHAKSTQRTFDNMSKVQNVLGKFGKNIISNS